MIERRQIRFVRYALMMRVLVLWVAIGVASGAVPEKPTISVVRSHGRNVLSKSHCYTRARPGLKCGHATPRMQRGQRQCLSASTSVAIQCGWHTYARNGGDVAGAESFNGFVLSATKSTTTTTMTTTTTSTTTHTSNTRFLAREARCANQCVGGKQQSKVERNGADESRLSREPCAH